jgi:hypothetical protein
MPTAERSRPSSETTPVLIPKATHRRLKRWAKDRGMKLGFAAEKGVELLMAETHPVAK